MPARDFEGCVRYLDFGNVPFSKEVKDINREKLEKRGKDEGRDPSFQMTVDDIFAVGLGKLIGRPQKQFSRQNADYIFELQYLF